MTSTEEITLATIETSAKQYAARRDSLSTLVKTLNDQVQALKRAALPGIKRAVAAAALAQQTLRDTVAAAPHLFVRPRTVIFHGIKCGWEKGKGKLTFEDPDHVCALIRKHFPEMADALIIVRETPNKKTIAQLSAADLKRLAITIEDSDDQVVIRAVDSDVYKIVTALLAEASQPQDAA